MPRPKRVVDEETIARLADYAGIRLPEDRISIQLKLLREQLRVIDEWENLRLGFSFDEGRFRCVRPAIVYHGRTETTSA